MTSAQPSLIVDELPPISAVEALRLLDAMIKVSGIWDGRRGDAAGVQQTYGRWLRQIRPHVEAAAVRSNEA